MTPPNEAAWDADTRRLLGKSLNACTIRELIGLQAMLEDENTRRVADTDRARACIAEAEACGCTGILAPQLPDGSKDFGRARVAHVCGRPS